MIVSWMTTNRCNLKCEHCYQDAAECDSRELTTAEGKAMIEQIARAGFKIMIFSGGEPLMRDDIFELVAHAAAQGLRPVFGSNGTLITDEVARKLKEAGACSMGISIDSLDAAKHDAFRGVAGAHADTLAGIEACKSAGLDFQIHTTVVDWNRDEVCDITDFAQSIGAVNHSIFFLIPVGRGKYIEEPSLKVLENEALLQDIMRKAAEVDIDVKPTCAPQFTRVADQLGIPTRYTRGCLAGLTYCVVGSEGIVRPCAYMTEDAGDVREQPFDEIWATSPVFERLRTQAYGGNCGTCDHKEHCGGCRARAAYYHDGDYMAQDDYCAYGQKLSCKGPRREPDGRPCPCRCDDRGQGLTEMRRMRRPHDRPSTSDEENHMKRIATKACACACALALAASGSAMIGCSGSNSGNDGAQQGATSQQAGYTFTDDLGNQVTVSTHERVVAGMGSFANVWELAGGTLVGASSDAFSDYHIDVKGGEGRRLLLPQCGVHHRAQPGLRDLDRRKLRPRRRRRPDRPQGRTAGSGHPRGVLQRYHLRRLPAHAQDLLRHHRRWRAYKENGTEVAEDIDAIKKKAEGKSAGSVAVLTTYSGGTRVQASSTQTGTMLAELGAKTSPTPTRACFPTTALSPWSRPTPTSSS